jgi:hypothetical protein
MVGLELGCDELGDATCVQLRAKEALRLLILGVDYMTLLPPPPPCLHWLEIIGCSSRFFLEMFCMSGSCSPMHLEPLHKHVLQLQVTSQFTQFGIVDACANLVCGCVAASYFLSSCLLYGGMRCGRMQDVALCVPSPHPDL